MDMLITLGDIELVQSLQKKDERKKVSELVNEYLTL